MNRLQMVANPWITDANLTDYRWQQTHGFSKKKNKQTNQNLIYASDSSSKAKTKIRNVTVGSTFGRFFTIRQMSPNPMDPIQ